MADDSRKQIRGRTTTCPVCGREFWCYDPIQWAYRERTSKKRHICSWHCQVIHNEKQEKKRAERQKYRIPTEPVKPAVSTHRQRIISEKKVTPKPAKKKVEYHWVTNLRELMQEKGISERDLAERSGFRRQVIGQWRRAETRCPDYKLDALADALGVSRAEFRLSDDRPEGEFIEKVPKQTQPPKEWHWLVNLGEIMREKGISIPALTKRSGIPVETISQWRRLKTKCPGYKLDILAEALGVTREAITQKKNGTA